MLHTSATSLLYRLVRGVRAYLTDDFFIVELDKTEPLRIPLQNESVGYSLTAMLGPGISWRDLAASAARGGQRWAIDELEACLDLLQHEGLIELVWVPDGVARAILTSIHPAFRFSDGTCQNSELVLSRFSYLRRDGDKMMLESPEAMCRIEFSCVQTSHWLTFLAQPVSIAALSHRHKSLSEFADLLWRAGFLELANTIEPVERATWEFHDLLFHWGSRGGRSTNPQGGTFRFLTEWPAPPAIKEPMSTEETRLPIPAVSTKNNVSLISIIERRRSVRSQGLKPISLEQITRLLYYTLRVQEKLPAEDEELLLKPVPAAGAIHEIEAYLAVGQSSDLQRGLYHYHAERHALYKLSVNDEMLTFLLDDAALSWAEPDNPPQVLVILASRFPRIGWKYESIAYRLTLLNAGAIIQSLYLLATEMDLACSAIGGGDSEVFAAATGLDPLQETSIAEFALGTIGEEAS
jgi:oxazoline/thiazoline dehydrogenase